MAEAGFFRYQDTHSFLKRIDPRVKLPLLLLYTAAMYKSSTAGALLLSLFIISLFAFSCRIKSIKEITGAAVLTLFIGTASFLSSFSIPCALLAADRFLMTVFLGLILIGTTHPGDIEKAVYWFVNPIPFISASEVAVRVRLTITFIPDIMATAAEIKEAGTSRCIQNVKNPVKKLSTLTVPLLYAIIRKAESTSLAMEARCYSGKGNYSLRKLKLKDLLQISTGLAVAAGTLLV